VKSRSQAASLWILSPWRDLAFFVLSPLWVIPLLWLAKSRYDPNGFGAMMLAVGAAGHHLPGFIRAYTDPVLFQRYRIRFILAPLFLLAVTLAFSALQLESLKLILIFWGTWHGAMQVNGFLRIYDSKVNSFAPLTSWLDWAMCIGWFGGVLLFSSRLIAIFSHLFNAGVSSIPTGPFLFFRQVWIVLLAAITIAFIANSIREARAGRAPSPVKLLMMASSFGLWWFAMTQVTNLLVGLLLFEIVHDLQYNVLVWVYNRRRVGQGMTASPVERFLFQPSWSKALLYVALILAYGGIADVFDYISIQAPTALQAGVTAVGFWNGLFLISTFLHFYFDGFIWQVRQSDFRQGMGIRNANAAPPREPAPAAAGSWVPAGWKWAFFLIPTAALGIAEYRKVEKPLIDQARNVALLVPDRWQANAVLGSLEKVAGDESQALEHLQRAVTQNPAYGYGYVMLGDIYAHQGNTELALKHYREAVALNPENYDVQTRLGKMLFNLGRNVEAIPHLQIAAEHNQSDANLAYVLGASLVQERKPLEGIPYLRRAVRLDPNEKDAFNYLGIALQAQGNMHEAAGYYRRAVEIDPDYVPARENLERMERLLASSKR
jgi:cytochrome c-type biogenesis protein CcmH/NrfG